MNINIRHETADDIRDIHKLTIAAFKDAAYTDHSEQFVVMGLRGAGALSLSLVAEMATETITELTAEKAANNDSAIVGHVAVSPVTISDHSSEWYGLGPISVAPELQGLGIGSKLMNEALTQLKNNGANGCVLFGDPNYYCRFGFKPVAGLVFPDVPVELFQAVSFYGKFPRGIVRYHDAFVAQY